LQRRIRGLHNYSQQHRQCQQVVPSATTITTTKLQSTTSLPSKGITNPTIASNSNNASSSNTSSAAIPINQNQQIQLGQTSQFNSILPFTYQTQSQFRLRKNVILTS
jgi:hypothetical protein